MKKQCPEQVGPGILELAPCLQTSSYCIFVRAISETHSDSVQQTARPPLGKEIIQYTPDCLCLLYHAAGIGIMKPVAP